MQAKKKNGPPVPAKDRTELERRADTDSLKNTTVKESKKKKLKINIIFSFVFSTFEIYKKILMGVCGGGRKA